MRVFEYRHVVCFGETNLVGNVYYVNHIRWQGRCREMFLRQYCPQILDELQRDLCLVTVHCSCDYLAELAAFDEVVLRMRLTQQTQSRLTFEFEYWKQVAPHQRPGEEQLVARGRQEVACMRRTDGTLAPAPVPKAMADALRAYAAG